MRTTAIVLAGGAASRFGGDKLAAELRGRPVLHHALLAVDGVIEPWNPIRVVLGPGQPEPAWPEGLHREPLAMIDKVAQRGPLAGIATGIATMHLARDDELALVVGGDMPSLVPEVLVALVGVLDADLSLDAAWLEAEPFAPLPLALRPGRVAWVVADLLTRERRSLRALLDAVPGRALAAAEWRALDPEGTTLIDIDTRDDLAGSQAPG